MESEHWEKINQERLNKEEEENAKRKNYVEIPKKEYKTIQQMYP